MVIPNLVKQALLGHPLTVYGDGTQSRCFTYVSDVVGVLLKLADHEGAVGQVLNVGNDREEVTICDLAAAREGAHAQPQRDRARCPTTRPTKRASRTCPPRARPGKLRRLTGYEPEVHLDEILDRVIEYFTSDKART
jgi:UDP-glucose 4-epimerase